MLTYIYRSPNSDMHNNDNLIKLMQEMNDIDLKYTILLGDFNLPNIK